jgi:hypothetical protein
MTDVLECKLELAFHLRMDFGVRLKFGPGRVGIVRGYTGIVGGAISGPLLFGRVIPHSGGDWPFFMPDGTVYFEAKFVLEAADGTQILLNNRGLRHAPPDILAKMNAFERVDPLHYYFRVAPTFDAPAGPHDWLNRTIIMGGAERNEAFSNFSYYALV